MMRPTTSRTRGTSSRASHGPAFADTVAAALRGEGRAHRLLYDLVAGDVLGYLRARGTPEPQEVMNDAIVAAFTSLSTFSGDEAGFRAWVFQIARHKRVDALRRLSRTPQTSPLDGADRMGGDVEQEAVARLDDDELRAVLGPLTPDQRDVLLLRIVADLSLAQTAVVLGKPVGAVKALQHRALARLPAR